MGIIKKLKLHELLGWSGEDNHDVYPVTSTSAVYDKDNKSLDTLLEEMRKGYQEVQSSTIGNVRTKGVKVYRSSLSDPKPPTGGRYDFQTGLLDPPEGWQADMEGLATPVWLSLGTAISNMDGIVWSTPVCVMGNPGSSQLRQCYVAIVYRNSAVKPPTPIGGSYDFGSRTFTPPEGWSTDGQIAVNEETWCSIKAFYSDGVDNDWSEPGRTAQANVNLTASQINTIAGKISVTANQLDYIASHMTLNAKQLETIAKTVTITSDMLNIIADRIDVSGSLDIEGSLNASDLVINGGNSRFNKDGSGYVANNNISWDTNGNLKVSGEVNATSGTFDGIIRSKLQYSNTKVITEAGKTYDISPDSDPCDCYFFNLAQTDSSRLPDTYVTLPDANTYDGLEIRIFLSLHKPDGRYFGVMTPLHVHCQNAEDGLYVRRNYQYQTVGTSLSDGKLNTTGIFYDDVSAPLVNIKGKSVMILEDTFCKFKAMGGSWYAIEGVFTDG